MTSNNQPDAARLSPAALAQIRAFQQNEVTEAEVYRRIARRTKDAGNRDTLLRIADEEAKHAAIWQRYTGEEMRPQAGKVRRYALIALVFGFTFAVKLMEKGEAKAQISYEELAREAPEALDIRADEEAHEQALLAMLDEERLSYVGSMVLGMNDAMVEMTGTLAGLTLAMQNTRLIALSGLITGIAATLSMASSEYLSSKSEGREDAFKSATYTGIAYLVTVALLILPYLPVRRGALPVGHGHHDRHRAADPGGVQLLHLRGAGPAVQEALRPDGRHQPGRGRALVRHRHPGEAVPGRGHLRTEGGGRHKRRPYPGCPPSAHARSTARSSSGVEMGCTSNSRTSTSSTPGDTNAGSVGPR